MKRPPNKDSPEDFVNQSSANLTSLTIKDTDETEAIQNPKNTMPRESRRLDTDEIEVLGKNSFREQVSEDKIRLLLTICVIGLFMISVMVGLVLFIIIGSTWLLFGVPVLVIPTYKVIGYYFYRPKEK
jgi:hypothetical protein